MFNMIKIAVVAVTMTVVLPVQAGSGHAHNPDGSHSQGHSHGPVSEKKVVHKAKHKLKQLVKKGKIDKSWNGVKVDTVTKQDFGKGPEYVVSFKNPKVTDKSKQALYIFYSLDGHYIAANHTGK